MSSKMPSRFLSVRSSSDLTALESPPLERSCKHCNTPMKRVRMERCWVCYGVMHQSRLTPHREYDSPSGICCCDECENERPYVKGQTIYNRFHSVKLQSGQGSSQ